MSDPLNYIRQAIANGDKEVSIIRLEKNFKTGQYENEITVAVNPRVALKYLSMNPTARKSHVWGRCRPIGWKKSVEIAPVKEDLNALSDARLLEFMSENAELLERMKGIEKAAKKAAKTAQDEISPIPSISQSTTKTDLENA